jgi:CheY-like chemotaxis protein
MDPKTVLVVHPNPATHRKVDEALGQTGFPVLHTRGSQGLTEVIEGQQVDVVLSAITLDSTNGYDLGRTLRDRFPAALIFLLAGGFEVYNVDRAESCGVDGRIGVPFTPIGLRAVLEDKLGALPRLSELPEPPLVGLGEVPSYAGAILVDDVATPQVPTGSPPPRPGPPGTEERLASFLPRDHRAAKLVAVDPSVVGPALEKAVLEVLPEVVEGALRTALASSPEFRTIVAEAVSEVLKARLPEIAAQVLAHRDADA